MSQFVAGQRWINDAELSLGLGTVLSVEHRTVSLLFHATGETRTYAKDSAPLTRIRFKAGDQIQDIHKRNLLVKDLDDIDGVIYYTVQTEDQALEQLEERDLDTSIRLNQSLDRLTSGQIDNNKWYELRSHAWQNLLKNYSSGIRGLTGARTSLIPHQLYIANEVATRYAPRVLLADEVGLGKTIEAGLILHHQLMTGRASRVLIIVPDALIHQWLVELLRRFNHFFSIFDEERCMAINESTDFENPFMAEQHILCSLDLFIENPDRFDQVLACDWDLLIVDEAHHLEWSEQKPSREYQLVEKLAAITSGILLLTATPEQFGKQSHFARLRLLDPERFNDFKDFVEQEKHYQDIANLIDKLNNDQSLDKNCIEQLKTYEHIIDLPELETTDQEKSGVNTIQLPDADKKAIISHLLDSHGTGRVLFRNTRSAIKGFPERQVCPHPLELKGVYQELFKATDNNPIDLLCPEILTRKSQDWTTFDTRIDWLVSFLKQNTNEKILLITHYAETAKALSKALKTKHGMASSVFHEELSIVDRDKRAADFADHETGVQILMCSEIGSEGRNFQFCHHIVLFDLPFNPDLLEQRIGRLDRIGQTQTIKIHVPFFEDTCQQRLYTWYHSALNAFNSTCPAGAQVFSQFKDKLTSCLSPDECTDNEFQQFLQHCNKHYQRLNEEMHEGRDRLLEFSSCRLDIAEKLVKRIEYFEQTSELKTFITRLFDCYGVNMDEHKPGSYIITPAEHMIGQFPGLDDDGMTITFDRKVALHHDDIHYFSWDHPMVLNGIDMLLSNELGNTSVCSISSEQYKPGLLIIQSVFIVEMDIPHEYQPLINRHQLQALPIEFTYSEEGEDITQTFNSNQVIKNIDKNIARQIIQLKEHEIKNVTSKISDLLENNDNDYLAKHYATQLIILENEIDRLQNLKSINPQVRDEEIEYFRKQHEALTASINHPLYRLDSIRLLITT